MANIKTKIVIVGGGFAGIKTVHQLYKNKQLDITIITNEPTFRYGATIWRATTGYLKETSYIPIDTLIPQQDNVHLVFDTATKINRSKKTLTTKSGTTYDYDYCVIGLGVVTSYFGIKGLEEFSYSIKSSEGFDKFRSHLHEELLQEHALDKNYVVVGAGPTGVELASALHAYLRDIAINHKLKRTYVTMDLVEAAPRVLPTMEPGASSRVLQRLHDLGVLVMTNMTVEGETDTTVKIGDKSLPSHTVIWTAGVTNNPFFTKNKTQFELNEKKRVVVDAQLRVDPHTFVIGDSAASPFSGLAITALHNASYVSKVITAELAGKTVRDYRPMKPVTIIPIGEKWAVFQWRKIVFAGRFASWLRTFYDLVGYSEIVGIKKAIAIWLKRNKKHEDCKYCTAPEPAA